MLAFSPIQADGSANVAVDSEASVDVELLSLTLRMKASATTGNLVLSSMFCVSARAGKKVS